MANLDRETAEKLAKFLIPNNYQALAKAIAKEYGSAADDRFFYGPEERRGGELNFILIATKSNQEVLSELETLFRVNDIFNGDLENIMYGILPTAEGDQMRIATSITKRLLSAERRIYANETGLGIYIVTAPQDIREGIREGLTDSASQLGIVTIHSRKGQPRCYKLVELLR